MGYGLIIRSQSPDDFYAFEISPVTGNYQLLRRGENRWNSIISWTPSSAIRIGERQNVLRVVAIGPEIQLYINGTLLNEVIDDSLESGRVGVRAINFTDPDGANIFFDDLVVYSAASTPTSTPRPTATPTRTLPPTFHIRGVVTDSSGNPYPNIYVYACPVTSGGSCPPAVSSAGGSYDITVLEGNYRIQFGRLKDGNLSDGYYSVNGFTTSTAGASVLLVTGDIGDINVQMPFE